MHVARVGRVSMVLDVGPHRTAVVGYFDPVTENRARRRRPGQLDPVGAAGSLQPGHLRARPPCRGSAPRRPGEFRPRHAKPRRASVRTVAPGRRPRATAERLGPPGQFTPLSARAERIKRNGLAIAAKTAHLARSPASNGLRADGRKDWRFAAPLNWGRNGGNLWKSAAWHCGWPREGAIRNVVGLTRRSCTS